MIPWIRCDCGEFWCQIHELHAFECECPPVEEWETDPYADEVPALVAEVE